MAASESMALHIAAHRSRTDRFPDAGTAVVQVENSVLEECLRQEMIRKYGPKSEKLSDAQSLLRNLYVKPVLSVS